MIPSKLLISALLITYASIDAAQLSAKEMLGQAKDYVAVGKKLFEQIEQMVNSSKIVDGKLEIAGLQASVDIKDIDTFIDYLQENPVIAKTIQGALKPEQTALAKATRVYTNIPAEKLALVQGRAQGVMGTLMVIVALNAAMPSTICSVLPLGSSALVAAGCMGLGIYIIYRYMPIPKTISEKIMYKATLLATHIAPYIGIGLAGSIKAAQEQQNSNEAQRLFSTLRSTLNITQKKLLSQRHVLLCAFFNPELLRHEKLFLNALNEKQVYIVSWLFKECANKHKSQLFDSFADTLTPDQRSKLKPENKLLIALFNPTILQTAHNEEFLKSLTSSQSEQLIAAIKSCEALDK